jgi:hypothetical protein
VRGSVASTILRISGASSTTTHACWERRVLIRLPPVTPTVQSALLRITAAGATAHSLRAPGQGQGKGEGSAGNPATAKGPGRGPFASDFSPRVARLMPRPPAAEQTTPCCCSEVQLVLARPLRSPLVDPFLFESGSQVPYGVQPSSGFTPCGSRVCGLVVNVGLKLRVDSPALPDDDREADGPPRVVSEGCPYLLQPLKLHRDHRSHRVLRPSPKPNRSPASAEALNHVLAPTR